MITRILRIFENWIDPYAPIPAAAPPGTTFAYLKHFVSQSPMAGTG
jgi:hypothetical protein